MKEMSYDIGQTPDGLAYGFTTGSTATGAAKAAARMLFTNEITEQIEFDTPKGISLLLDVENIVREKDRVTCCIRKYSGDDPDVTDGLDIYACASRNPFGEKGGANPVSGGSIVITAGEGIGVVTKKGLPVSPGEPAINPVPRAMLFKELQAECDRAGYEGKLYVRLWIPRGRELAKKTFNPRLGIVGGLSVLGTSGIVEPMSEKALVDTIKIELSMLKEEGYTYCYVVPGNYGADFLEQSIGFDGRASVKCSNFVGETIDMACRLGMKGILLVGHAGKFIKLAAGIMNTHSRWADCRIEPLAMQAALAGADINLIRELAKSPTTTHAIRLLDGAGLLGAVMDGIMEKIGFYIKNRCRNEMEIGAIVFLPEFGILGKTENVPKLQKLIKSCGSE